MICPQMNIYKRRWNWFGIINRPRVSTKPYANLNLKMSQRLFFASRCYGYYAVESPAYHFKKQEQYKQNVSSCAQADKACGPTEADCLDFFVKKKSK